MTFFSSFFPALTFNSVPYFPGILGNIFLLSSPKWVNTDPILLWGGKKKTIFSTVVEVQQVTYNLLKKR